MSDKYTQTGVSGSTFGDNAHIEIKQEINAPKVNPPIADNVPPSSVNFVGREKELKDIHVKLQTGQGVSVCAVEGMGGLGKSELALQYAGAIEGNMRRGIGCRYGMWDWLRWW
ncbi:MAG: hypothetical protein WCQ26_06530 [Pseudanabaena sp. ELA748]